MDKEQFGQGATIVHRLLARLVGRVCDHPRLVLAVAFLLGTLSVAVAWTRLEYRTHRNDLISSEKECQKLWQRYLDEFGSDDDMVVVVRGSDPDEMKRALDEVAEGIGQRPELFTKLFHKVDLAPLRNRALLLLPAEEVEQVRSGLEPMSRLLQLGPLAWRLFTLESLVREAHARADRLGSGTAVPQEDERFFSQLAAILRSADVFLAEPGAYRNPWRAVMPRSSGQDDLLAEPQYFFSPDRTLAFLLVRPIEEAGSFTAAQASVEGLREILTALGPSFPGLEFGLTGLPVLENDEMVASRRDTELASWLAFGGVAVLYFLVFRGFYYPVLTVGTLLVGIAWAMGWLTVTIGHLNILSATFAVMLIAMGDYGVLWVTRYEQARRLGFDVRAALVHTATHVAVGNLTAATALALAFFAAILADFQAVAELGWIAGCGVLLCAAACFTVLPAVLILADRRGPCRPATIPIGARLGWLPGLSARPWAVIAAVAALVLGLGTCARSVRYDHNLLHLQDPGLDSVKWEHTLIKHTSGSSWYALSVTDTPREALALKARYEQLPEVSRVVEVASLVPPDQDRKLPHVQAIHALLQGLPPRTTPIPHIVPDLNSLREALTTLSGRLKGVTAGGKSPAMSDLDRSLGALHQRLATCEDGAVPGQRLREFEQRLTGDLSEDLHRLRDVSTPEPITLADLPPALRERFVGRSGKWLLRVFARDSLWEFGPLEHFTQTIRAVDPQATGKPFGTVEGLRSLQSGFLRAGLYALVVIVLVLLADFRSIRHALLAVAPLGIGLVMSLGVMGLLGKPLNPANIIALPLILGVGIDNGVHVLHDYLLRRAEGHTTISRAIGRGVLVKALTTMIGFGALMVSSHRGLAGLGVILMVGVGCCMLTALVFLPAVLRVLIAPAPVQPASRPARPPVREAA